MGAAEAQETLQSLMGCWGSKVKPSSPGLIHIHAILSLAATSSDQIYMNADIIVLLSRREIDKMRPIGQMVVELLSHLEPRIQPGVSTLDLNNAAETWMAEKKIESAIRGYNEYPKSICTSVNEVVCNGIPAASKILANGDIINVTAALRIDGFYGKASRTFLVGEPSPMVRKLVKVAEECLNWGVAEVKPGARIGDIGAAIQERAESQGFSVVRDYVGHGIGRVFHAPPQIPHYGIRGKGIKLRPGMAFTIQPMINQGGWEVEVLADRWTAVTKDRRLSAQFEHMVVVTAHGVEVLTPSKHPRPTDVVLGEQAFPQLPKAEDAVLGPLNQPE